MQQMPSSEKIAAQSPSYGLEQYCLVFAFALYICIEVNAVFHHGSWGQDFNTHLRWTSQAVADPWKFLTTYPSGDGRTNPPLFHLFSALIYWITGGIHYLEVIGLCFVAFNTVALYLLHTVMRRIIHNSIIRVACLILILFLPFALIHAVVFATDALATPLFIVALYLFALLADERTPAGYLAINVGIAFVLVLGLATKFTFVSLVPASLCIVGGLLSTRTVTWRRAAISFVIVGIVPGLFAWVELRHYMSQQTLNWGVSRKWVNPLHSPYMNVRSELAPRRWDTHVLSAPPYDESIDDGKTYLLLVPNRYSYPALLHLAMFTDILNFFQYDPYDFYFGIRSSANQAKMSLAVKTGLAFSVGAALSVPVMILWSLYSLAKGRKEWLIPGMIVLMSCAFFLNIVAFFPFVPDTYLGGYWTPRLVAPALLCFAILGFTSCDRILAGRRRGFAWACLCVVIVQSGLHVSFLWPWGNQRQSVEGLQQPRVGFTYTVHPENIKYYRERGSRTTVAIEPR